jgi:hypothetical protein
LTLPRERELQVASPLERHDNIAENVVVTNCGQIKTGSLSRSCGNPYFSAPSRRRLQLLRFEPLLGKDAVYAGTRALTKARRWIQQLEVSAHFADSTSCERMMTPYIFTQRVNGAIQRKPRPLRCRICVLLRDLRIPCSPGG